MTKLTLVTFMMFLALYFNNVMSANGDEYTRADKRKDGENKYAPLWFGPRIGRRKRNPTENIFKNLDKDEMDTLVGALKNPWNLMALSNAKRKMDYTPRLGRDSTEEEDESDYDDFVRHKPFTPRLGRRISQYSPRLGRENDILLQ